MLKKISVLVFAMVMVVSMTACGASKKEEAQVTEVQETETQEVEVQVIEVNARDFNMDNVEKFFEKWYAMESHTSSVLNPFAESLEVTEDFLSSIHTVEAEYQELLDYTKTLTVEEYQYQSDGHVSIQDELEAGWVREPIMEVTYDGWKYTHGWDYNRGTITIEKGYYVEVCFTDNLESDSAPDDANNDRVYTIKDSNKDAYLLYQGELGYELIRIIAE